MVKPNHGILLLTIMCWDPKLMTRPLNEFENCTGSTRADIVFIFKFIFNLTELYLKKCILFPVIHL